MVREYIYVYAAVAPQAGKMTSLILPSADTAMMNLFLSHVARTFANYFIVMQVDRAEWHLAEKQFSNVAAASLDEVIDRLCDGLIQLEAQPKRLRSMTYFPHFKSAS